MNICQYVCVYTHTHKRADRQLARVPTGAYGCPRVPTGLEKSVVFLVCTIRKCPFKGQKCTKILVVGTFGLGAWSLPNSDYRNPP